MAPIIIYAAYFGAMMYAWKDWYRSLCVLIVLMFSLESGYVPKNVMDIPGLNLWNLLLVFVLLGWASQRRLEGLRWDLPSHLNVLLGIYLLIILVGFLRAVFDRQEMAFTLKWLICDLLINSMKWLLPGILLFHGCNSHDRLKWGLGSILLLAFLMSVLIFRTCSPASLVHVEQLQETRLRFDDKVGYNAVDVAAMLSGAVWAFVAFAPAVRTRWRRLGVLAAGGLVMAALGITGGRAGLITFALLGLLMGAIRWRKWLLLAPVAPVLFYLVFPAPIERVLDGVSDVSPSGHMALNAETATSGRSAIWPPVIKKIEQSPMVGYGRQAMERTQVTSNLFADFGERDAVNHPHNIYLEWLLDNGLLGLAPMLIFFGLVMLYATRLFRSQNPWAAAVGGTAFSLAGAQLIAGMGSQHFYPMEGNMIVWSSIFLMFRAHVAAGKRAPSRIRYPSPAFGGELPALGCASSAPARCAGGSA